jgi:hypothetical protein
MGRGGRFREMSEEMVSRRLAPPAEMRVVRAGEGEARVIPGAKPWTAVFGVIRGGECTLLALQDGRWVLGDGWSREMAARALGGQAE